MSKKHKMQKLEMKRNATEGSQGLENRQNQNKGKQGPPMARETEAPKGNMGKTIDLGKKKGQKKSGNSGNQENRRAA